MPGSFVPRDAPSPPHTQVIPEPRARCSWFPVLPILSAPHVPGAVSPTSIRRQVRPGSPSPLLLSSLLLSAPSRPSSPGEAKARRAEAQLPAAPHRGRSTSGPPWPPPSAASSDGAYGARAAEVSAGRIRRDGTVPGQREPGGAGMRTGSAARSRRHRHRFGPLQRSPSLCRGAHPKSRGLSQIPGLVSNALNPRGLSVIRGLTLNSRLYPRFRCSQHLLGAQPDPSCSALFPPTSTKTHPERVCPTPKGIYTFSSARASPTWKDRPQRQHRRVNRNPASWLRPTALVPTGHGTTGGWCRNWFLTICERF